MYALVDCNNFFVSCERAFQPQLEGRPVVVLSNNDGCVVARSNESKAMGIKMGTPFFQVKEMVERGRLEVRSSNYTLYGDLSRRVMEILEANAPKIEVYSIDEAFMVFDGLDVPAIKEVSLRLVREIRRSVGIPVSIGIAPSKTLAKAANHFAKKYPGYHGVCAIDDAEKRRKALKLTPIDDVWGIGRRMAPRLVSVGVKTALDFTQRPVEWIRKHMGITGVRTWQELQGTPVIGEESQERRQSICTSRSFDKMVDDKEEMVLRVSDFAGICAAKLRQEGSAAGAVSVFVHTNRFREDLPQYYPFATVRLAVPSSNTQDIISASLSALETIWKPGFLFKRAGVMMSEIIDAADVEADLFDERKEIRQKQDKVSELMDKFNAPGKTLLRVATQRPGHYADGIKREHCSKQYSTSWKDMLEIH